MFSSLSKAACLLCLWSFINLSAEPLLIHEFRSRNAFFGINTWINPDYSPGYVYNFLTDSDPSIGTTFSQSYGPEFGWTIQVRCGPKPDTLTGVQFCGAAFVMPFTQNNQPTDFTIYSSFEMLYAADKEFNVSFIQVNQVNASYSCAAPATPDGIYQTISCNLTKDSVDAHAPGALALPDWACSNPEDSTSCVPYQPDSILSLTIGFTGGVFDDTTNVDILALCLDGHETCNDSTVREGQILKALTDSSEYRWGCTDSLAPNYNPNAEYNLGNCLPVAIKDAKPGAIGFRHNISENILMFNNSKPVPVTIRKPSGEVVHRSMLNTKGTVSLREFTRGVYIVQYGFQRHKFTLY